MSRSWTDFGAAKRALGHRAFARYSAANGLSLVGLWVQRLTVGWLAWELSHSGFWLGAVVFAEFFPVILVGPVGGVLADRLNRVRVSLVCQALAAVQSLALCLLTAAGLITVELLVLLTLVVGLLAGINQPARLAMIPALVPRADLGSAVAINASIFNLARFIGPALAGVIIAWLGPAPAFGFNALSYLWFIGVLYGLRRLPQEEGAGRGRMASQIAEGIVYALRHPLIGPLMLVTLTSSVFARPLTELLPGLTDTLFGRGPEGLAILVSTTGLGALAGSLWLAGRDGFEGLVRVLLTALLVAAGACAAAVATPYFPLAMAALTVFGFTMVVIGAGAQTLVQASVAPGMRGRVLGLNGMILRGGPSLGALVMGWTGDFVGLRAPLLVGATVCALVFLVMLRRAPALGAALEPGPEQAEPAASAGSRDR